MYVKRMKQFPFEKLISKGSLKIAMNPSNDRLLKAYADEVLKKL